MFEVKPKGSDYETGDTVSFELSAFLVNGLPANDTEVQVKIRPSKARNFYPTSYVDSFDLPKILFEDAFPIPASGKMDWQVPDSILLPLDMRYSISFECQNANGELHLIEKTFRYDHFPEPEENIQIRLDGDNIRIESDSSADPSQAWLLGLEVAGNVPIKDTIFLPHEIPLNGNIRRVSVQNGLQQPSVWVNDKHSLVQFYGERTTDSIKIYVANPRGLQIFFSVAKEGHLIRNGFGELDGLILEQKDRSNDFYQVRYFYWWGGNEIEDEVRFGIRPNALIPDIHVPESASPGDTIAVQLQVKNYKGRNKANLPVSALAINDQFNDKNISDDPQLRIKRRRFYRPENNVFNLNKFKPSHQRMSPGWQLQAQLGLDQELEYRLLFPKHGLQIEYLPLALDSTLQAYAQVAAFIAENQRFVPIISTSIDRLPVDFYDLESANPYSFLSKDTLVDISLRIHDQQIDLKDVPLKIGYKCLISFNLNTPLLLFPDCGVEVIKRNKPDTLTTNEKNILSRHLYVSKDIKHGEHYIRQGDRIQVLPTYHTNQIAMAAMVDPLESIEYEFIGHFNNQFLFEPGFSYQVSMDRERLYQFQMPYRRNYKSAETPRLGFWDEAIQPEQFLRPQPFYFDLADFKPELNGSCAFMVLIDPALSDEILFQGGIQLATKQSYWQHIQTNHTFSGLEPGSMKHYVFFKDSTFVEIDVSLHPDTLKGFYMHPELPRKADPNLYQAEKLIRWYKSFQHQLSFGKIPKKMIDFSKGEYKAGIRSDYHGRGTISGKVRDETGFEAIGASVLVYKENELIAGTSTDLDGNYLIEGIKPGAYDVHVEYIGMETT
ncbi:MAG: carboxypeptidase regulatory-like domain-containing protein, partial [Bacteroidota bacterium]